MSDVGIFKRVKAEKKKDRLFLRIPDRNDIAASVLLFLSARASILDMSPFCPAMFGAVYDKKIGYLGMALSIFGLFLRNSQTEADIVKYIIAMTGFWLYSKVKEDYKTNRILSSAVCGILVIAGGICTIAYHTVDMYNILLLLAEGILTAFSYIIFANASNIFKRNKRRSVITQEEIICISLCTGIFISGFSKIPLPYELSLVSILSMYCVISLSFILPLASAGSAAVALGMLCVQESGGAFSIMGTFGLCALIANMLKSFGKAGSVIGFTAGCGIIILYNGSIPIKPAEVLICACMVMLTPRKYFSYIKGLFDRVQTNFDAIGIDRMKKFLSKRINATAENFRRLSVVMLDPDKKSRVGDICDIFDDTASQVCSRCGMNVHCWKKEYNSTYNDMLEMFNILECKGTVLAEEIPENFKNKCIYPDDIRKNLIHVYELYKQNAMWEAQTDTNRSLVAHQYNDIADIMEKFLYDLEHGFNFLTSYEKNIEAELDKAGIKAEDVSVLLKNGNEVEVFVDAQKDPEIRRVVSSVLEMPVKCDEYDEFTLHFSGMPRYSVKSAYLRESKYGCGEYGDSIIEFSKDPLSHTFILSDGMGSGAEAKRQSELSCSMLKAFISAGYSCRTSIELLNSTLALKSSKEIFSTVDMIDIDLKTGCASLYKAGSAETIIMRGGNTDTILCDALPIGMLNISEISTEEIQLEHGDIIVMMSDGIKGRNIDNDHIYDVLYTSAPDPDIIAEKILADALHEADNMPPDDMSVIVMRID